jgi:hypothetical protein
MEKRNKHRDDPTNVKLMPSVLPDYILPLDGVISCDNVSRDFKYKRMTAYLPKGIHTIGPQLGLIPDLKINKFNPGDRNNYAILAPHRYLTKMMRKKQKIVLHPWIKEIARSTILNIMKIPHFDRH